MACQGSSLLLSRGLSRLLLPLGSMQLLVPSRQRSQRRFRRWENRSEILPFHFDFEMDSCATVPPPGLPLLEQPMKWWQKLWGTGVGRLIPWRWFWDDWVWLFSRWFSKDILGATFPAPSFFWFLSGQRSIVWKLSLSHEVLYASFPG